MRRAALVGLVLLSGCIVRMGRWPHRDDAIVLPQGANASIVSGTKQLRGELLEVRDTALVVLTTSSVVLVPLLAFDQASFDDGTSVRTLDPRGVLPRDRDALRLLSRYPPGMPDAALGQLLSSRKLSALEVFVR